MAYECAVSPTSVTQKKAQLKRLWAVLLASKQRPTHHHHTSMSSNSTSLNKFLADIIWFLKADWFGYCFNIPCSRTQGDKDSTQCIFHNHCPRRQKIPQCLDQATKHFYPKMLYITSPTSMLVKVSLDPCSNLRK